MFGEKIVAVPGFLAETTFQRLLDAFQRQRQSQRVHIPVHKRGAALSYHDLQHSAPEIISFYHSRQLHDWCSLVVGDRVVTTPSALATNLGSPPPSQATTGDRKSTRLNSSHMSISYA